MELTDKYWAIRPSIHRLVNEIRAHKDLFPSIISDGEPATNFILSKAADTIAVLFEELEQTDEENQKYRAIGTVEEVEAYKKVCDISNLAQLSEYREIGTVEECRIAVENQKEKTPVKDFAGKYHIFYCPECGEMVGEELRNINQEWSLYSPMEYCCHCGQALSWEDEE